MKREGLRQRPAPRRKKRGEEGGGEDAKQVHAEKRGSEWTHSERRDFIQWIESLEERIQLHAFLKVRKYGCRIDPDDQHDAWLDLRFNLLHKIAQSWDPVEGRRTTLFNFVRLCYYRNLLAKVKRRLRKQEISLMGAVDMDEQGKETILREVEIEQGSLDVESTIIAKLDIERFLDEIDPVAADVARKVYRDGMTTEEVGNEYGFSSSWAKKKLAETRRWASRRLCG